MSLKLSTRQLMTASLAVAVAGTAVVTSGVANAAPGASAKVAQAVIEAGSARAVAVLGTGFKNPNGTIALTTTAASSKVVAGTAACTTTGTALAVDLAVASATRLTATIPAITTPGSFKLCILVSGTTFVSAPFAVAAAPALHATKPVVPATGPTAAGASVVLTAADGKPFRPNSTVTFGGRPASKVTVASDGLSLVAIAPAGAVGAATITISAPGFSDISKLSDGTTNATYTYINTVAVAPKVTQAEETVSVQGVGFGADSQVWFSRDGGATATITCASQQIVSSTEMACKLKPTVDIADGAYTVVVDNDPLATFVVATSTKGSSLSTIAVAPF